ncbi:lebercilin-like isoform X2 [Ruditapes philippinarum]|uniref:lebercilin-like isoform X2 n=1 Tax=Ruditapes philippinarum TaxID=129788 RepID=UPI00295B0F4F|nr:lebercilin-like isoform X2 [Ruditapes philippinarum]
MTHRNRAKSPYDSILDDDDDYSDDFDDDATDVGTKRYKTKSPLNRTASGHEVRRPKDSRNSDSNIYNRSNRGRGRGKGRFSQLGRNSHDTSRVDNITKRVLSARRLKINEIQNQNQELLLQLKDLKDENKLLKKTQHRADKALQKFEDRESDLPQLIQRQNNEVRSLKDQIRKWREKYEKTDRYLRDAEDELEKAKSKLKKLKTLADEKDLPERSELNKKLHNAELDMEAKDVKVKELERHIQNLEKNHRHQLGIERARHKDTQQQLTQLREENEKLNSTVKEKDKEIQMKNIYANRAAKPPHRLPNSYNGTPHNTPPPRRRRPSLSETDKMTPRDRAKQMEDKRREELRRQRELKQQHEKMKREKELRKMKEEDERREEEMREMQETERREYEEREREMNAQAEREAEDRRMREERDRMKRDAEERKQREREKAEREDRERMKKEKREREERERRERERQEQERRAAEERKRMEEERKRFEDDVSIQAERKKKDEILQKLREIDEGGQGQKKDKKKDPFSNDGFFVTEHKEDSQDSMASSKKSYTFSKPIENLHKGKPARKDDNANVLFGVNKSQSTNVGRRRDTDSIETGGYNPTFAQRRPVANSTSTSKTFSLFDDDDSKTTSTVPAKPAQKSKLMAELFGSKDNDGPKHNDIFSSSKPPAKKSNQSHSTLPWEDDGISNRKQSGSLFKTNRENSATLFGGGSAFVNDEDLRKSQVHSNASLPRRPKQPTTTFHTRPTVNAIDNFDDDIEEVIL